jgi:type IV fimbrial biogenesis protein FimT
MAPDHRIRCAWENGYTGHTLQPSMRVNAKPVRGFPIIELMVTLAVAAILLALALPNFHEATIRSNVSELNNNLIQAFNLARSEAVRRGKRVRVQAVGDSSDWNQGWSVSADVLGDGSYTLAMTSQAAVLSHYSVCTAVTGGGSPGTVIFTPLGSLDSTAGMTRIDLNVNRPDTQTTLSQQVWVTGSGQVQSKRNIAGSPAATTCP